MQSNPDSHEFLFSSLYKNLRLIGEGGFSKVCAATDTSTGERVAIKRIMQLFQDLKFAKQTLREIRLLRFFRHENIISLKICHCRSVYLSIERDKDQIEQTEVVFRVSQEFGLVYGFYAYFFF